MTFLNSKNQQLELFVMPDTMNTLSHYLKKEEILPLPDLINFFKIQFMHRFTQDFLPASFNQVWVRNNIRNIGENEIQLRNSNRIQAPPL